jgi:hypothetical protein
MKIVTYITRSIRSFIKANKRTLHVVNRRAVSSSAHSANIRRRVAHALALKPRGAVRDDVLAIKHLAVGLRVEWFARDTHPWDRDLPERRQAELFAQQCLEDVDAAIPRLFKGLPEIEVLEISVLERNSQSRIITGVVHRSDFAGCLDSSLGMRLKTIGLNYQCSGLRLEPIG